MVYPKPCKKCGMRIPNPTTKFQKLCDICFDECVKLRNEKNSRRLTKK